MITKKEQRLRKEEFDRGFELGKKIGKEELIEKLIELLELREHFARLDHGHSFQSE